MGVIRMEVVVENKPVNCILDVIGVNDELLWAFHRTLRDATGNATGAELPLGVVKVCVRPV